MPEEFGNRQRYDKREVKVLALASQFMCILIYCKLILQCCEDCFANVIALDYKLIY